MGMINEVKLAGVASTKPVEEEKFNGESICSFVLTVCNNDKTDNILVRVSDRFIDFKKIDIGAYVQLRGTLRSVNKSDGNKRLIVSVFVSSMKVLDEVPAEYENEVKIQGTLCSRYYYKEASDNRPQVCDRMIQSVRNAGKKSSIPVACRGRNAEYLSTLETGSIITCEGVLRERKYRKLINGESKLITTIEVAASTIICSVEGNS